jgi:arginase family enzyme
MSDHLNIADFLLPINPDHISQDEGYKDGQIGKHMQTYTDTLPWIDEADIVLVGCGEERGMGIERDNNEAPFAIRHELYNLFYWHQDVRLADIGDIKPGATLGDTYAALKTVVNELVSAGKTVIILGGSHDLTLAQYHAYASAKKIIEATCVDAKIDLNIDSPLRNENFLMEMLVGEPNFVRHYNHIGFQSYLVHPRMLETMDKLRFDCYRLGNVKEHIEEMEPVLRTTQLLSFDIAAIQHAHAPASIVSPNGFSGEEACTIMRYAGMSANVNSIGIYGYRPEKDNQQLTAKQIAHMIWYVIDGRSRSRHEADLDEKESFNEYHTAFAEVETIFLQSKKTGRWWMQLPNKQFIACSYKDYLLASSNEVPERWLRAQERD